MVQIKFNFEKIFLVIFLAILFFIGPGITFEHKIKHEFPYGYYASDAFQHQVRAEAIKDAGNFRYEASYISRGFEGTVGRYPPIIYHLAVLFSYPAGLEVYDSIYFLVFFFAIIGIFIMYFIIKDFNKNVALIALPLSLLTFSHPNLVGFTWGHWPSLVAQFFLIGFFWCMLRINIEKPYILMSIIFSAIILTHTSEAAFAIVFLLVFFGIRMMTKNLQKAEIKNVIIALILAFVISFYYLTIFKDTWAKAQPYSFGVEPVWEGTPGFYIGNFGALLIFILPGILFSLFKLKGKDASIPGIAMLLGGFLNYVGFSVRAFQIRFFWPIYLSIFFGFGIYMLTKPIAKKWNSFYIVVLSIIFTILLTGIIKIPLVPHYNSSPSQGIMDSYHWSALTWLSKNTEPDSKLYFFYGDIYDQDALLRNSKRFHYQVDTDDFVNTLKNRKIKSSYVSELPGDGGGGIVKRTGLFSFEYATKSKPQEYFFGPQNICNFDYFIFDKANRQKVLADYNLLIASQMLNKSSQIVFQNELVVILKNNKVGGDCIAERNF